MLFINEGVSPLNLARKMSHTIEEKKWFQPQVKISEINNNALQMYEHSKNIFLAKIANASAPVN